MAEEKKDLGIIAIVALVAIVGLIVLMKGPSVKTVEVAEPAVPEVVEEADLAGQAFGIVDREFCRGVPERLGVDGDDKTFIWSRKVGSDKERVYVCTMNDRSENPTTSAGSLSVLGGISSVTRGLPGDETVPSRSSRGKIDRLDKVVKHKVGDIIKKVTFTFVTGQGFDCFTMKIQRDAAIIVNYMANDDMNIQDKKFKIGKEKKRVPFLDEEEYGYTFKFKECRN